MSVTDPIADMFTSLRNASRAGHEKFDIPASGTKKEIALILKREGFIKNIRFIEDRKQGVLRIYLKFDPARKRVAISGVKRISKPGLRIYAKKDNLPRVLGGLGVALLSTSRGIMTDEECRKQGVGGEVLGHIW